VDYQIQRADEIHGRWQISVEVNSKNSRFLDQDMLEGERRDERKNSYEKTVFNRVTLAALVGFCRE